MAYSPEQESMPERIPKVLVVSTWGDFTCVYNTAAARDQDGPFCSCGSRCSRPGSHLLSCGQSDKGLNIVAHHVHIPLLGKTHDNLLKWNFYTFYNSMFIRFKHVYSGESVKITKMNLFVGFFCLFVCQAFIRRRCLCKFNLIWLRRKNTRRFNFLL